MQKTDWLMVLQGLAVALQVLNADVSDAIHNKMATLIISAVCAGVSVVVQHIGNQTMPDKKP